MTSLIKINQDSISHPDDVKDCDFIFLMYCIHTRKSDIREVTENNVPCVKDARDLAIKHNKKLIYYSPNDRPPIILPNDPYTIVCKETVDLSHRVSNEYIIPVHEFDDVFDDCYLTQPDLSIGFVGHLLFGRKRHIDYLTNCNVKTDFIIRDNYFHGMRRRNVQHMKNEYYSNIKNNLFTFCYRGAGNFSVRFYETLMMGRIPIVINTNCMFPYDDIIDYNKVGLFINESDLENNMNLEQRIQEYYRENINNLLEIQKNNRELYVKYFSKDNLWNVFFRYIYNKLYPDSS